MEATFRISLTHTVIILIFSLSSCFGLSAQTSSESELSKFHISVEYDSENKVSMKCDSGCAWKTLSFFREGKVIDQAVDEFGMTEIGISGEASKFLFTVSQTENGLAFVGLKGTAFKTLTFTLKPYQQRFITATGMTKN